LFSVLLVKLHRNLIYTLMYTYYYTLCDVCVCVYIFKGNLNYSCFLRLRDDQKMSVSVKIIDDAIKLLGLDSVQGSIVGRCSTHKEREK